jgi:hypothetical protein
MKLALVVAGLIVLAASTLARAQSSAALLVKPWEVPGWAESNTSGLLVDEGHIHENGDSYQLSVLESQGRVRLFPDKEASPRFGYDMTLLNSHTSQPKFPHQLLDASFSAGAFVGEQNGWIFAFTAGAGYAGGSAFAVGRGWYGRGDILVAKKFTENDALGIGLDYDGHRLFLPDTPIPGFGYSHTFDPHLDMVLGLPISSITWKPTEQWRIYLDYTLLADFDIDIGYEFIKHWTVFTALETRRDQFHISALPGNTRLLYSQKRVEGGIRYVFSEWLNLSASVGYAFSTDFRFGFDTRDTNPYLYATDEPYIRASLNFKF